jgi:2'-5' RNA ligase
LKLGNTEGLRMVGSGNWHVTLRFLGEVDDGLVPALVESLRSAAASLSGGLRCQLGPGTGWFSGDRVLQVPVRGLDDIAGAVRSATLPLVPERSDREPPFSGHLTVARSKGRRLDAPARGALVGIPFAATFDVDSFDLVASDLAGDGPRYRALATLTFPG